ITCPHTALDAGDHMDCTATYTTQQSDVVAGDIHNTADVTGTAPDGSTVTDDDDATVTLTPKPDISVVKTASATSFTEAGKEITYTYRVTNTGNVPLTDVRVTDDKAGMATCPQTTLAVGEHMDCTATYTTTAADVAAGRVTNVGTATGTGPNGEEVKADSTVTVPFTGTPPTPKPPTPTAPAPTPPSHHPIAPPVPVTG
ncbi:MAG: hypothetical protein J2P24_14630, partial [Streptosporangiales bacterium]|nr:hypothetical protein [Streptosporangiales bacterium]